MPLLLRHAWDEINHASEGESETLEVTSFVALVPRTLAVNYLNVEAHAEVACSKRPEARGKASILKNGTRPPEDSLVTTFNVSVRLVNSGSGLPMWKTQVIDSLDQLLTVVGVEVVEVAARAS